MRRFLLCCNIERLTQILISRVLADNADYLRRQVCHYRRELALLDASEYGALNRLGPASNAVRDGSSVVSAEFEFEHIEPDLPTVILDPGPGLQIVYVNRAFSIETGVSEGKLIGRRLYEAFPENPEAPESECISHTFNAINRTTKEQRPEILPEQRYDIRNPDGVFVECYWRMEFLPLPGANEEVEFIKLRGMKILK